DKATGNEQSMTITASTNLSDNDIQGMVKDAEKYAEEDAKRKAQVETKNNADQMVYQGEKLLKDLGDKVSADLKTEFEKESEALKKAMETDDYEKMKTGTDALQQIIFKISEKAYGAQGSGAAGFDPSKMGFDASQMPGSEEKKSKGPDDEDVVDIDFEDID
ncbi:MAG: Hsp70 family protein, partial [Candidatus Thorarchaeota archaeon]